MRDVLYEVCMAMKQRYLFDSEGYPVVGYIQLPAVELRSLISLAEMAAPLKDKVESVEC